MEKTERGLGGGGGGWGGVVLAELNCVKVEVAVLGFPIPNSPYAGRNATVN